MNFMSGLAIFLCPIAAILSTDYWLVKKRAVDVPSLYRRRARYRYDYGCNWRAAVAFLVSVSPNLPGWVRSLYAKHVCRWLTWISMAQAVNPSINLSAGIEHVVRLSAGGSTT